MKRSRKHMETWKRLFVLLLACTMLFSNVSGSIRALDEFSTTALEDQDQNGEDQTSEEALTQETDAQDNDEAPTGQSEEPSEDTAEDTPAEPEEETKEEAQTEKTPAEETPDEETPTEDEAAEDETAEDPSEVKKAPAKEPTRDGETPEEGTEEVTKYTVTFYTRDGEEVLETRPVEEGSAIGALPKVPDREDYTGVWVVGTYQGEEGGQGSWTLGDEIDATYVVNADVSILPKYDLITHTVRFYTDESKSSLIEDGEKIVDANSNYCVNDIPAVPTIPGSTGKWVYADGDFTNSVAAENADLDVWASYDQKVFTVTYMVDADTYQTDTYYNGDTLSLPEDPVVEGKEFIGWYVDETKYEGGEAVTSDLTITARFQDEYEVSFVVVNDDGTISEKLSQYFRASGEAIGTLPQDPFVAGKVFKKWVIQGTDTEVTAATEVTGPMTVVAVFNNIDIYDITAEYYYLNDAGNEVIFNTDLLEVEARELPYTITAPASTKTDNNEVAGAPIYYPEAPTIDVTENMFDADRKATVRFKYIPFTAKYDFVYMLKDLKGDGYTEIDRTSDVEGVLNSYVTPTVKTFDYAVLERVDGEIITTTGLNGQPKQELPVYYTRKNFQLTYDSKGGSFVSGVTVPYGTQQAVTSEAPTRAGYTFAGWYLDEDCTQTAGSTVTVNGNTTLYAKWTGNNVNYTIVYMFEKYNDTGTASEYVYDNSKDATAKVGSTVQASSAPTITRTGWEKDTTKNASSSVEIAADGSSVLYVYYKLTEYTFSFNAGTRVYYYSYGRWQTSTQTVTATLTGKGVSGTGSLSYTFKAKLGQDISSLWPDATGTFTSGIIIPTTYPVALRGWHKPGDSDGVTQDNQQILLTEGLIPSTGNTITYTAYWVFGAQTYTINIYLQDAEGEGYTRSDVYSKSFENAGISYYHDPINGYIFNEDRSDEDGGSGPTWNFYYDRYQYRIDYKYLDIDLGNSQTVRFGANIDTDTYDWKPTSAQCGVDSDYTFDGWYEDSGLTSKYAFTTMPASNLILYAKWNAPTLKVSFDTDGGSSVESQTVEKYKTASAPETNPTKDGYIFDGWYSSADGTDLFQWNTQITEDTTVYAHWSRKTLTYTVRYVDEKGDPVADDKVVTNPNYTVGQEVNEHAIAIAGYRPDRNTGTLTLTGNDTDNVITFIYKQKSEKTSYIVRYVIADGETGAGTEVATQKNASDIRGDTASVIELAAPVDYAALYAAHPELNGVEFFPDEEKKTLVLSSDVEENVITFYYSSYKNVKVTVNFVDMNGDPIPGITADTQVLKVGKTFTLSRTPITGWEFKKAVAGTDYSGTPAKNSYKITQAMADSENDLVFTLFYQKKATITAKNLTKQYDGKDLKLPSDINGQVEVKGLLDGDDLTAVAFDYANTDNTSNDGRLNAGTATVTPKNATISGKGTNPNYYTIRYISGTLEVTKINVTVRIEPDRWTGNIYNAKEYKAGFTNNSKKLDDYIQISHAGYKSAYQNVIWETIKNLDNVNAGGDGLGYYVEAQTDAGNYPYDLGFAQADLPKNDNYSVSLFVRTGRLEIKPAELTVTTGSAEKQYDGTPLTKDEATITGFKGSDSATVTANGTITEPGSTPNTYEITWGEGTKATNYKIKEKLGTLTVIPATLSIIVKDKTATYNGAEQKGYSVPEAITGSTDEYTVTGLVEGDTLKVSYTESKGTNAGTYENGAFGTTWSVVRTVDGEEVDVTSYYTKGEFKPGKLTIDKAPVTVTADNKTKEYGDADPELTAKVSGLQGYDTENVITYTLSREEGENVGSYKITPAGATEQGNYTVSYVPGNLTITKATVTVTADSKSKEYGEADPKLTATVTGLKNGDAESVITYTLSRKEGEDVGSYAITPAGAAEQGNYDVVYVPNNLTITKAKVVVTAENKSKEYGDADPELTASVSGLKKDDDKSVISYTLSRVSGENVGEYTITPAGEAVQGNYDVEYVTGTLTITKAKVIVTADNQTKKYGEDDPELTAIVSGLKNNDDKSVISYTLSREEGEDVGSYAITPAGAVEQGNYDVEYVPGALTITKRTITLTSATDSKVYDGTALTNDEITVGGDGFVEGEGATYDVTGTQTDVGSSANTFTYTLNDNTKAGNYTITTTEGTLTVTELTDKVTVTITEKSGKEKYDGSEKTVTGYTVSIDNNLYKETDFTFSGTAEVKGTDAGSYPMELKPEDFTNTNKNFKNVEFVIVDGTLEISKRTVTLTSADGEKPYDGTPLTKNAQTDVTVGGDGFADGEGAAYNITGTQTNVGESKNTFTYTLNGNMKAANYNISTVEGTLKVTEFTEKVTVTIKENSGSKKYDGAEMTVTGYTVTDISNELYKEADFTFSGNATVKGTDAGSYDMKLKPEDFTNNNKNFANVEFVIEDGRLTITKRSVTLTSADGEKVYDGTPLTKNAQTDVTVSGDGFVEGEGATYRITGTQTEVGNSPNAFSYTLNEGTETENYIISTVPGTLTVTELTDKVTVTITENSGNEKYDGKEKTVEGYTVSISNPLYKEADFTFSGEDTVKGTDAGSYPMELKPADFKNTNKNFTNVEFVIVDGTLEISKRTVTLTSADDEKVYDGQPLTNNTVTVGGDGFATGEGATYDVTGTRTEVGTSANTFNYTLNEGTKADNYTITKTEGTLKVTELTDKITVTITENSGSEKYDGTEKTVTGYTVSIDNELYTEEDFTFTGDATVKGTDAGTYNMELKAADFANKNANFSNVEFVIVDGKLEISKRKVTLTSADGTKVYDGQPLTKNAQSDVTVTGDGFATGEGAVYNITGTQTEVGESPNAFTYTLNEGTKAANYDITKTEGTLKVTELTDKVTVTITEHSGSEKYDGTEKTVSGYDVKSISNPLYTEADFTFNGNATVKGTDAGSYPMELKPEDFTNNSKNFSNVEFVIVDGTLEISKRSVTLTSADDEKVYDGKPLTKDEVTIGGDGFATGEGATYDVTGTRTEVGTSANTFTYTLNEGTKAANYDITKTEGTLKVTELTDKVTVTITENSGSEKYDGTEKTVTGYTVSIDNELYTEEDFTFSGDATVNGTDAGSYPMNLKPADFKNTNANFSNVEFMIVDGTLEISKRTVTLTSASGEKVYDGQPLTKNAQSDVTVTGDGFADGEGAVYNITGTQTEVGSSANAFTYTLNADTKADNYEITKTEGTLTVTELTDKVTVTITEKSGSEKYDGSEKKVSGYEVTSISNPLYTEADFTFNGNATVKGTDAGSYPMNLKPADFTNTNKNFTNVEFVIVDGTLEISKRTVTLTSADGEKVYDGTPLTKNAQTDVTAGGDGFANGEGATYDITGTQTEVGSSANKFTYTLNEGTKADNYTITKTEGTLKVTELTDKVTVTITENSGSEKYDGSEKTVTGYTVSIDNELYKEADFEFSGDATVKGTDAGSYPMNLKPADFTNTNKNFTNVEFVIVDGTLEISKRTVTLTSADDEKVYDGTPLTNDEITVGGDGFVQGEGATYDVTGTQTEVGSSANKFTYTLNEGTKADNYTITTKEGTLTVKELTDKVTVTITENSGSEKYDGSEKTVTGYTVKIDNKLYTEKDFTFSGDATVKGTDAGTYNMELKAADFTNTNKNFSNVEFVIVDGTLKIEKRTVTLTSADDEKVYDGTPLTNDEITVGGDGFVQGEGANYVVTGTQTEVGSCPNAFTYTLKEGTKADNYTITKTEGTLKVTELTDKVTVTITENSGSEKYDGTEKTVTGYTVSIDNELYTVNDFAFSGDATVQGTDAGTYDMELKAADFTNTNKNFKNVEFVIVDGTLKIAKRDVTLTSADATKEYDGLALTNGTVSVSGDGFVTGEGATYTVTGSQTEVGTSANKFTYELNANTKADNYNITKVEGTLKVTQLKDKVMVTITENSGSEKYDGTEKTVTGYTVSIDNDLYKESDFTFSGDDTVKGTDAGTYDMELKAADFTNTNKNFATVEFVIVDGTLQISKRTVTLTSADGKKEYDGTPLTKNAQTDVKVTGDGFVEGQGATYDITGTQTEVGDSKNKFTYTLNDGTKAGNYEINTVFGTLEVTKSSKAVTITSADGTWKYDGADHSKPVYTVKYGDETAKADESGLVFTLSTGDTVTISNAAEVKNVSDTAANNNTYDYVLTNADQYQTVSATYGTLTITPRSVTMTSATDSKEYDGKALTNDEVTVSGDGFVNGEGATYDVTGSQTEVGSSKNEFTYTLNEGTLAENYNIQTANGTLTVSQSGKVVTITSADGTWKYDGAEHSKPEYTVKYGDEEATADESGLVFTLSTGDTVTISDAATVKNVSDTKANNNTYEYVLTNASQYKTVTATCGTLTITPRSVTMTSATDSKEYDGEALTNDEVTVSGDGFVKGEGATYDVTGSQTEVGESENEFTYKLNEGTLAENYDIRTVNGTLTVSKSNKEINITSDSKSWKYDGAAHDLKKYTVTFGEETITGTEGQTVFTLSTGDKITISDAPSVKNVPDTKEENNTFTYVLENANQYEKVTTVYGTLTITARSVNMTSADDEKVYDGTALTNDTVTVTGDGFVPGEGATYDVTGTQTEAGNSPNAFTYTLNEGTMADNYTITTKEGTLTVTELTDKVTVTITENSGSEKYDGTEKKVTGYTVSIDNELYTEADFEFTGNAVVQGTDAGTYQMELKPADFTNKNENFTNVEFVIVDGTLEISKRTVTLTSADDEKVYDGTALTNNEVTVGGDGFVKGEGATYDVTGSQTNVGNSPNAFTYTLNEGTKADNYTITTKEGTLTVTELTDKVTVTITENSGSEKYDGSEKTVTGYTVSIDNELYKEADFEFTGNAVVKGTDAGTYPMTLKPADFTNTNENFSNVEFVIVDGTLEIAKRTVSLTSADGQKVYDGQPLTKNAQTDVTVGGDGFADGEGATYDITGTQTEVGSSANKFTYTLNEDTKADNYTITTKEGNLTVTELTDKVTVTITENSGKEQYDGSEKTVTGYTVSIDNELYTEKDFTFGGDATINGTDAGTYPMELKAADFKNTNKNFSNVEFVIVDGTLEIAKRTITLTSADDEKKYDGTALTNHQVTVGGDGFANGEGATYEVTGSQTDVGDSPNTFSYTLNRNTKADNYTIKKVEGTLTVTKNTTVITITADSGNKEYDGTALLPTQGADGTGEDVGYTYTQNVLAEGDVLVVEVSGSQTVAGSSASTVTSYKVVRTVEGEEVDITGFYTFAESVDGTLVVTKKSLTITASFDSKVYDGAALTNNGYTKTALAEGDKVASVSVTGSQINIGTSANVPSAAKIVNATGDDVTESYDITYVNGNLKVTKKALTITADSDTKVYDGTALTKDSYKNTELAKGDKIESVTITGSQTVVGSSDNVPSDAIIKNADGADVTRNYDITYANGTLEVTKNAALIITADSDTKVYDGAELTKDSYQVAGLAEGDKVESVTITGSQTIVGKSDNVPSAAKIVNAAGEDVTESYTITYKNGSLEVTPKQVTITAGSDTKVYDGTELKKNSYTKTDLAKGDEIDSVTVTGAQTVVGKSDNVPSAAKIVNAAGDDVTSSYEITYVNGSLEVTPMAVTITADDDSKVYDGKALTKDSYKNTDLARGDKVDSVKITGSQTVVGKSDNVPSAAKIVNAAGEDVTSSYEITYKNGSLEVTPKKVTITADSDEKVYDGKALTKDSYKNTDLAEDDKVDSVKITGSQTVVGKNDNVPSAAKILNADGDDVTSSYEITYANGSLEVTPKKVTFTAASDSKVYDGAALTNNGYTKTALAEGDEVKSITVAGSQINVGTSDNVPSAAKIVNAAGDDVTESYDITYVNGSLEVTKKALTITADSDTKVYDGKALTKDSYTNTALAEGDEIEKVTVTGSQTVVGKSDNVPSAAVIKNADGAEVTRNYEITYANGTLEVTKNAALIITADSDTKVYDGKALTKDSYQVAGLAEGDKVESVTITGAQTVVGKSDNVPSAAKIVNAKGEDVTASYTVTYKNGTLEVTPMAVTITAGSDTKVYDGTALTKNSYTKTDLAEGDKIESVTVTGTQTTVGKSDNVPSAAKIVNAAGDDVTESYDITYVNGTLEVTKKAVTITAASGEKVYDGTALVKAGYENTDLAEGDDLASVMITGSQTVVGKSDNVPSAAKITNAEGEDVTESYEITYVNGSLEVTKKALTITADSDEKVYDGTELTKDSYTRTDLAKGDKVDSVTITGSQTVVGKSDNVPSKAKIMNADGVDVTDSYDITYVNGSLEVTKKALTITADSDTKVYDGTPLTKDSYTNTVLAEGDKIESVTVTGAQTVVGKSDNVPSEAKIVNAKGEDVTASYDITYTKGSLEVTQKAVTITADSDTKIYDGTPLTKDSYTNTDLAAGDKIESVTITGAQTVVGKSDNVPSAAKIVNAKGEDVTASYDITYANGTLQVTKNASLIITADSDTKVYDGTALTKKTYQAAGLAEGDKVESVTVTGSQTVAGTSDNVASAAKIVNAKGEDVTASYEITYQKGTLEVTKKPVTITASSASKVFDGTALTKNSYEKPEIAEGDKVESVTVTGSQTFVGSSDNVPSAAKIANAAGEDVTSSYEITYANGTLTVTDTGVSDDLVVTKTAEDQEYKLGDKVTFTVTATNIYATAQTITLSEIEGVTLKQSVFENVKSGATVETTATYTITQADILKGSFTNTVTAKVGNITKTADATVHTEEPDGHLTIKKVTTSETPEGGYKLGATIEYKITVINDGNLTITDITVTDELTNEEWQLKSLAPGATQEYTTKYVVTEEDVLAGEVVNVATGKGKSPDPEEPEVPVDPGKDPEPTTTNDTEYNFTAASESKKYDGEPLTNNGWTLTDKDQKETKLPEGYTAEVTVEGTITNAGDVPNKITKVIIKNAEGEDVTDCFSNIKTIDGTLKIEQRELVLISATDKKPYDGTPLTRNAQSDVTISGDGLAAKDEGHLVFEITGSQTLVGSSDNVFTYHFDAEGIQTQSAELTGIQKLEARIVLAAEAVDLADNYKVTKKYGTLTVTDKDPGTDEPVPGVVSKTHEGEDYALGETITFNISVKNIYDETKTITLVEIEGMELSQSVFEGVAAGATITATATHVVTEADILNGSVKNEVTAKFSGDDTPDFPGEDEVTVEDPKSHATIDKKVINEKETYTEGDTIEYEITITNDGNMTLKNVKVSDELTGDEWTIKELAPGEKKTFNAEYKVTAEDAKKGSVENVATATGETVDPDGDPEIDPGKTTTPIDKKKPTPEPTNVPKTGDSTDLGSWVGLMVASLAGAGCTMILKRKKEEEETPLEE